MTHNSKIYAVLQTAVFEIHASHSINFKKPVSPPGHYWSNPLFRSMMRNISPLYTRLCWTFHTTDQSSEMQEPVYLYSNQREAKKFRSITVLSASQKVYLNNFSKKREQKDYCKKVENNSLMKFCEWPIIGSVQGISNIHTVISLKYCHTNIHSKRLFQ